MRIGINYRFVFEPGTGRYVYITRLLAEFAPLAPEHDYVLFVPAPIPEGEQVYGARVIVIEGDVHSTEWDKTYTTHPAFCDHSLDVLFQPYNAIPKITKTLPLVVTVHDLIMTNFYSFKHLFSGRLPFPLISTNGIRALFAEPREYRRPNRVVVISDAVRHDVRRLLKVPDNRIDVVYNGVDHRFFRGVPVETQFDVRNRYGLPERFVLYLGGFIYRKNIGRLIKAHRMLPNPIRERFPLVLVGNGYWERMAKKFAASDDCILHIDKIPFEDLPSFYRLASLFVYPSISEGFGIPVLEALASRTPTITSAHSPMEEITGGLLRYFDPFDVVDMANTLQHGLTSSYRAQMENAYPYADRFDWREAAQKMLWVFDRVYKEANAN